MLNMVIMSDVNNASPRSVGKIGTSIYVTLPKGWAKPQEKVFVIQESDDTLIVSKNAKIDLKRN